MRTPSLLRYFKHFLIVLMICAIPQWQVNACEGTPRPPCGQTMWFMILVQRNIPLPQNGQINIPVVLVPYLWWNTNDGCAQPAINGSGSVESRTVSKLQVNIDVKFLSVMNGTLEELGIQSFELPVPTEPGLQTMQAMINVPDGLLDPTDTYIGQFDGTAIATFENGVGAGELSASTTTQAYLVPSAPGFPDFPRVNIEYVPIMENAPGYLLCRRGDQAYMHFLVSNNDLTNSVTLDLSTRIGQVAGLPDGFDPANAQENFNAKVFAIADLTADYFNHKIVSNPATWELLPEGDPHNNPSSLSDQITLLAGEAKFVTVCVRSFGMCANGSCNKVTLIGEGQFSDGADALACAASALIVDDMNPKSRRCEYRDSIKASANAGTCFSKATYLNDKMQPIPHATTLAFGNVGPGSTTGGWCIYGVNQTMDPGMFSSMYDYFRFDENAGVAGVSYSLQYSGQTSTAINTVIIFPLPSGPGSSVAVPVIRYLPFPLTDILIKADVDSIYIETQSGELVFAGKYSEFLADPPEDFILDLETCRSFTKYDDLSANEICASVYNFSVLHKLTENPQYSISVYNQNGVPILGEVAIAGDLIQPPSQTFDGEFSFNMVKTALTSTPNRIYDTFIITAPNTLTALKIPFVAATLDRLQMIITNELELIEAMRIIRQRRGHMDLQFDPENGSIHLTNAILGAGVFDGDGIIMEQFRSPEGSLVAAIDGSGCPPPCEVFTLNGNNNEVSAIQLMNFPGNALTLLGDNNAVSDCVFNDNGGAAVVVEQGIGNTISEGSFSNNAGLGIDLGADGVTGNDPVDIDSGANQLQNFPVLTRANIDTAGGTFIEGEFNSTPKELFNLQFYVSGLCDDSGFGEGMTYMTSMFIMTDDEGDASFSFTAETEASMGEFITATATGPDGSTSEFSECREVIGTTAVAESNNVDNILVFPNPANGRFNIQLENAAGSDVLVIMLDKLGTARQVIFDGFMASGKHLLDVPADRLPSGLYFVQVQRGIDVQILKVIVQ